MYPENLELRDPSNHSHIGCMNMGYVSDDTTRTRTLNLFRPMYAPILLHSLGSALWRLATSPPIY